MFCLTTACFARRQALRFSPGYGPTSCEATMPNPAHLGPGDWAGMVGAGIAAIGGLAAAPKSWRAFRHWAAKSVANEKSLEAVTTIQERLGDMSAQLGGIQGAQQVFRTEVGALRAETSRQSASLARVEDRLEHMDQKADRHAEHDDQRFTALQTEQKALGNRLLRVETGRAAKAGDPS